MQKRNQFYGNRSVQEFHLGKRKLHLKKKGISVFTKSFIASYKQDRLIFFHYDLVTVNDCLIDTLKKQNLVRIRKDNLSKLIFALVNINSTRNKLDSLADVIKDNIDINIVNILMLSATKVDRPIFSEQPVFFRWIWNTISSRSKQKQWRYYAFHQK